MVVCRKDLFGFQEAFFKVEVFFQVGVGVDVVEFFVFGNGLVSVA